MWLLDLSLVCVFYMSNVLYSCLKAVHGKCACVCVCVFFPQIGQGRKNMQSLLLPLLTCTLLIKAPVFHCKRSGSIRDSTRGLLSVYISTYSLFLRRSLHLVLSSSPSITLSLSIFSFFLSLHLSIPIFSLTLSP